MENWKSELWYRNTGRTKRQENLPCEILYLTKEQQSLKDAEYGENLTEQQHKQSEGLLHQHSLITGVRHGSTTKVKHKIITTNQRLIRQQPYHIPPALKKDVVTEFNKLLKPSIYQWLASNEICEDCQKLNTATHQVYLMARIDNIRQSQYLPR